MSQGPDAVRRNLGRGVSRSRNAAGTLGGGALGRARGSRGGPRSVTRTRIIPPGQGGAFHLLSPPLGPHGSPDTSGGEAVIRGGSSGEGAAASGRQPHSWQLGGEWPAQDGIWRATSSLPCDSAFLPPPGPRAGPAAGTVLAQLGVTGPGGHQQGNRVSSRNRWLAANKASSPAPRVRR